MSQSWSHKCRKEGRAVLGGIDEVAMWLLGRKGEGWIMRSNRGFCEGM
jgi:hypothetical protein